MSLTLPALTFWQPWASMVAAGIKPYEFRGYAAPVAFRGHRIAVHAGARPVRKAEIADLRYRWMFDPEGTGLVDDNGKVEKLLTQWLAAPKSLPLSTIVCTAVLGEPRRVTDMFRGVHDSDRLDHSKWGWPLTDIRLVEPGPPVRGEQGFFRVPRERCRHVLEAA